MGKGQKKKDDRLLKEVEEGLETLYNSEGFGYLTKTHKLEAKQLEEKKRNILLEKEKEWRLKSRAIWLQAGDENSKFFHRYANGRKNINFVWKIDKGNNRWETNFKDIADEGVNYFSNLFKEDSRATIVEVIRLSNYFPNFVNNEDNLDLMKEVGKDELLQTLQSFQRDKIPWADGLPMEFFLGCYEFIEEDLRGWWRPQETQGKCLGLIILPSLL
jgi:hypothetical protein